MREMWRTVLAEYDTVYHFRNQSVAGSGPRLVLGLGVIVYQAICGGKDVVIHGDETSERIVIGGTSWAVDHRDFADEQWIVRWTCVT